MTRQSFRTPGYDCRRGVCPHTPKCNPRDAGIDGGRYHWVVRNDASDLAAVVHVFAADFPDVTPEEIRFRRGDRPIGGVAIHAAFPTDREDILKGKKPEVCEFLGKPCWVAWESSLALEKFVPAMARDDRGVPVFEQPEAFWAAVEAFLVAKATMLYEARTDTKWKLCPCCKGEGTVAITVVP